MRKVQKEVGQIWTPNVLHDIDDYDHDDKYDHDDDYDHDDGRCVVVIMMIKMIRMKPVCKLLEHLSCDEVTGQLKVAKVGRKSVLDQLLQLV